MNIDIIMNFTKNLMMNLEKMCESSFLANLVFAFLIILQMSLKVGVLPQNLSTRNGHIYPFSLNLVWTLILVLI